MKKKKILFLSILLVFIVSISLLIYFFNKPESIKSEIIGTEYGTEDIQFDLVSDTFPTIPKDVIENEDKVLTTFVSSDNRIIMISSIDKENLFIDFNYIDNPFYLFQEEVKGTYLLFSLKDFRLAAIKVFHGEDKDIVYYYARGSEDDGSFSRYIEVLADDLYYSITLANYDSESNVEADAYEIISSVNIIRD